jgi:hypothetical protein
MIKAFYKYHSRFFIDHSIQNSFEVRLNIVILVGIPLSNIKHPVKWLSNRFDKYILPISIVI